jgi:hypothetical protein
VSDSIDNTNSGEGGTNMKKYKQIYTIEIFKGLMAE